MKDCLRDNYSMEAPTPAPPSDDTLLGDMAVGGVVCGTLIVFLVYLLAEIIDSVDLVELVKFLSSVLP
jgi:hypothetical protein